MHTEQLTEIKEDCLLNGHACALHNVFLEEEKKIPKWDWNQ